MRARLLAKYSILLITFFASLEMSGMTRWSKSDPYPLYSSTDPYEFMSVCRRTRIKDVCVEECVDPIIRIAASPFRQSATLGSNLRGDTVELGNMTGRWNMLGLFYDPAKRDDLLRGLDLISADTCQSVSACTLQNGINLILDPEGADPLKEFGFFTVPIKYRKYGVRGEVEFMICDNFTFKVQGGVSHIVQEPLFIDLTCSSTGLECPVRDCQKTCESPESCQAANPLADGITRGACKNGLCCVDWPTCPCKQLVIDKIMDQKYKVAKILGLNIDRFDKTGFEDVELSANWSTMYTVNFNRACWPEAILTPFITIAATIPSGEKVSNCRMFGVPFGNNGHWSIGGRLGFTLDFVETISIGAEVGATGFSTANHGIVDCECDSKCGFGARSFPTPTNDHQFTIFPELVNMRIKPGLNWNFGLYMGAYHFLDRLSTYVQYMVVGHDEDCFRPLSAHPHVRLDLQKLERESLWRSHFINAALNYDVAPWLQLGFVWQIPVAQTNAYQSTTVMGTIQVLY